MILEFTVREQLICCLVSVLTGVLYGILYDVERTVCILFGIDPHEEKKSRFILRLPVMFLDLTFMAVVSISFSVVMYAFAYGKFRLVFGLCCLAGFVTYNRTVSKFVIIVIRKLIETTKKTVVHLLRLLFYPVRSVLKFTVTFATLVYSVTLKPPVSRFKTQLDVFYFKKRCKKIDTLVKFDVSSENG